MKRFLFLSLAILAFSAQLALADHYFNTDRADLKEFMQTQQDEVSSIYNDLDVRVRDMDSRDPKKKCLTDGCPALGYQTGILDDAKYAKDQFKDLNVDNEIIERGDLFVSSTDYDDKEAAAREAIREVQTFMVRPIRPADVPEGDVVEDFIPQLVRLLFQFASIAALISFVVSGTFLVLSFDNEERVTKAKQMLYYTFVGFAFIVMAYAIVSAITDIDFFGFG